MKAAMAMFFAACVHPVHLATTVHDDGETLWIGVNGTTPGDVAALHFVDSTTAANNAVCHSPERGRPLWQQLDQGTLRVVCTANANRLSRKERLEQRYQVPVALAPSQVEHLVVAVPERTRHGAVLHQDLLTAADPLALRVDVQRAEATGWALPDGAWGVLQLSVGPDHPVLLQQRDDGLRVQVENAERLVWTKTGGWSRTE